MGENNQNGVGGFHLLPRALLEKLMQGMLALSVAAIKHPPQSSIKEKGLPGSPQDSNENYENTGSNSLN